jgi:hypothetical protein
VLHPYEKTQTGQAMPLLNARLARGGQEVLKKALADSGAGINVLPQRLGKVLGFDWNSSKTGPKLSGNAEGATPVVMVEVQIAAFESMPLLFAWSAHDRVRQILGQDDFFMFAFSEINKSFHEQKLERICDDARTIQAR